MSKEKIRKSRNGSVTLKLDLEENDKTIEMFSRSSGLFCVSKQKILRYRSPDDLDPSLEHDSVPWEQSIILPLGSTNYIVARTILQTSRLISIFFSETSEKYKQLSDISWSVMNSLVSLQFIKNRLETQINEIVEKISNNLDVYTQGNNPKPLPAVSYYDIEFRSFVNEVRRCLNATSELFPILTKLEFGMKHKSYKENFGKGNFQKAHQWASEEFGRNSILAKMLENDLRWINTWIDIRNAIEHPKHNDYLETVNFSLEADRKIRLPTWRFINSKYDMARPQNLLDVFEICINNLLKFYEDLQLTLLDGHLPPIIKIAFETIPEEQRNPEMPFRYKFSTFISR